MKRHFERGQRVSVPYGLETRITASIDAGPFHYTDEELEDNKQINELNGYSTKRMPRTYYRLRVGRKQTMTCAVTAIKTIPKRA